MRLDIQAAMLSWAAVKEKVDSTVDTVDFLNIKHGDNEKWKADLFKDYDLNKIRNR